MSNIMKQCSKRSNTCIIVITYLNIVLYARETRLHTNTKFKNRRADQLFASTFGNAFVHDCTISGIFGVSERIVMCQLCSPNDEDETPFE